ncbi:hypothetical protein BTVI_87868 [Pitangus sulphuratus]|nr:hypothetical protein BTVI_87868 [Pitangus sulphuratus]
MSNLNLLWCTLRPLEEDPPPPQMQTPNSLVLPPAQLNDTLLEWRGHGGWGGSARYGSCYLCQVCWSEEAQEMLFNSTLLQPCGVLAAGEPGLEREGRLRMDGRTRIVLQLQQELPGFGAFRLTALMQH